MGCLGNMVIVLEAYRTMFSYPGCFGLVIAGSASMGYMHDLSNRYAGS